MLVAAVLVLEDALGFFGVVPVHPAGFVAVGGQVHGGAHDLVEVFGVVASAQLPGGAAADVEYLAAGVGRGGGGEQGVGHVVAVHHLDALVFHERPRVGRLEEGGDGYAGYTQGDGVGQRGFADELFALYLAVGVYVNRALGVAGSDGRVVGGGVAVGADGRGEDQARVGVRALHRGDYVARSVHVDLEGDVSVAFAVRGQDGGEVENRARAFDRVLNAGGVGDVAADYLYAVPVFQP